MLWEQAGNVWCGWKCLKQGPWRSFGFRNDNIIVTTSWITELIRHIATYLWNQISGQQSLICICRSQALVAILFPLLTCSFTFLSLVCEGMYTACTSIWACSSVQLHSFVHTSTVTNCFLHVHSQASDTFHNSLTTYPLKFCYEN
jgi:hypothetical protein